MPGKRFGKYRSRKKKAGGLVGDIGRATQDVASFVGGTGKKIADVAAKAAPILGKAIEGAGKLVKSKEISDVGKWTAGAGRDIAKFASDAAPIAAGIGKKVGSYLESMDPEEEEEVGGSLYDTFKFKHGKHAARAVAQMGNYQHKGIQAAARHLAGMRPSGHPILTHRTVTSAATKHFRTIANSTKEGLAQILHRSSGPLHKAVSDAVHSAHMGGGINFGGSLWDDVGTGVARGMSYGGSASKIVGGATAGVGAVMSMAGMPEFGVPLMAAGGTAYAMGQGAEKLGQLGGSDVKTPNVTGSIFKL
jgi:hypothetical protein